MNKIQAEKDIIEVLDAYGSIVGEQILAILGRDWEYNFPTTQSCHELFDVIGDLVRKRLVIICDVNTGGTYYRLTNLNHKWALFLLSKNPKIFNSHQHDYRDSLYWTQWHDLRQNVLN